VIFYLLANFAIQNLKFNHLFGLLIMKNNLVSPIQTVFTVLAGNGPEIIDQYVTQDPPHGARIIAEADDLSKMILGNVNHNSVAANSLFNFVGSKLDKGSGGFNEIVGLRNAAARSATSRMLLPLFWESISSSTPEFSRLIGAFGLYKDWQIALAQPEFVELAEPIFRAGSLPDRFFQNLVRVSKGNILFDGTGKMEPVGCNDKVVGVLADAKVQQLYHLYTKLIDYACKHDPYLAYNQEYAAFKGKSTLEYIAFCHARKRLLEMRKLCSEMLMYGVAEALQPDACSEVIVEFMNSPDFAFEIKDDWRIVTRP
jgi:hypothetical protein